MNQKKLVLVDMNNVMYRVVFSHDLVEKYKGLTTEHLSEKRINELVRDSMEKTIEKILNILQYNTDYDVDILFAKDGRKLWRKKRLFGEYKAHRESKREKSSVDFDVVFQIFDRIWSEIQSVFPFRFIEIQGIEVDDVLYATVLNDMTKYDKIQIYSTDSDFEQLLRYPKLELYNPNTRKFIVESDSEYGLFEKIIRGDESDNIPNIYSSTRSEKQRPIFTKTIKYWYDNKKEFNGYLMAQTREIKEAFVRNTMLIDMRKIPKDIMDIINQEINKEPVSFDLQKYLLMSKKYNIEFMKEKVELVAR